MLILLNIGTEFSNRPAPRWVGRQGRNPGSRELRLTGQAVQRCLSPPSPPPGGQRGYNQCADGAATLRSTPVPGGGKGRWLQLTRGRWSLRWTDLPRGAFASEAGKRAGCPQYRLQPERPGQPRQRSFASIAPGVGF